MSTRKRSATSTAWGPAEPPKHPPRWKRWYHRAVGAILANKLIAVICIGGSLLGIVGFIQQQREPHRVESNPVRVEITGPQGPIKLQRDPFAEPFVAHNSGAVDLTQVEAGCLLNRIGISDTYTIGPFPLKPLRLSDLPAGQHTTITCPFNDQFKLMPEQVVKSAYILVWIRGNTPSQGKYTAQQSFEMWTGADGKAYWLPQAQERWRNPF